MKITLSNTCQALLICCRDMGAEGVAVDGSNADIASSLIELGFATIGPAPERRLVISKAGASHLKENVHAI